jgi:hypothetical protein
VGNIVIAWIVTIPASAGIAALAWWMGDLIFRCAGNAEAACHRRPRRECFERTAHLRKLAEHHEFARAVETDQVSHHRKIAISAMLYSSSHHPFTRRQVLLDHLQQSARLCHVAISGRLSSQSRPANL